MPMQYTANFNGCKNDNFKLKFFFLGGGGGGGVLIFAQNIDCGYSLEPPQ